MRSNPTWMTQALCLDKYQLFFDETRPSQVSKAVAICSTCAVKTECLQHALEHHEIGIWGGMTTNQRAKMMRKKRRSAVLTEPVECSNVSTHGAEEEQ